MTPEEMARRGLKPVKDPDYLIEGRVFDSYAPIVDSVETVYSGIRSKVSSRQTRRVVVNLKGKTIQPGEIRKSLLENPIENLQEVIVIDNLGNIHKSFP